MSKSKLCKSCSGPLDEFDKSKVIKEGFCPYCVDSKGELKSYAEIMDGMIEYIISDHPEVPQSKRKLMAKEWLEEGPVWREVYTGLIIEESLEDKAILKEVKVEKTEVADEEGDPTQNHGYPVWTLKYINLRRSQVEDFVAKLCKALKKGPWYADLKGREEKWIVFRDRFFKLKNGDIKSREEARKYGLEIGIPENQLTF